MQHLTEGADTVDIGGRNLREVIENIDRESPGIRSALVEGDKLRPGVAVVVNGCVSHLGLLQKVQNDSEIQFIPMISGG